MVKTCLVTGLTFETTPEELTLRSKLQVVGEPQHHPIFRFMQLGAFWQHWNLYKRTCDKTGASMISVYTQDCPYPVWHRSEWLKNANPPGADVDFSKPVFPQLWEVFRHSPIAHNIFGSENQNCEYTDDWWHGKNCYLSHSGVNNEDVRYCYRVIQCKDCQFCAFSFESERSCDLIHSYKCFRVRYALECSQCSESAFLYDCRNCHHCMFCSNLRNKQYCFANQQLTKGLYEERIRSWDLHSQSTYERAKNTFQKLLKEQAWHRAASIEHCENVTGDYLDRAKDCTNCYFLSGMDEGMRDCINVLRGGLGVQDCLDSVGPAFHSQLIYGTTNAQEECYDLRSCYNLTRCKWLSFSANCFQCQHCFGCCGLVGRSYYIFNKAYTKETYEALLPKIIAHMRSTGEYDQFLPSSFAATPYSETIAGFYWPLGNSQAEKLGFRTKTQEPERVVDAKTVSEIPDRSDDPRAPVLASGAFWDTEAKRPFQIQEPDISFASELGVPLPHTYYARRLQENFRLIPFDGRMHALPCAKCKQSIMTSWPDTFSHRVLCERCYVQALS